MNDCVFVLQIMDYQWKKKRAKLYLRLFRRQNKISDVFHNYFGGKNGVELEIKNKHKPHEPMDFDE